MFSEFLKKNGLLLLQITVLLLPFVIFFFYYENSETSAIPPELVSLEKAENVSLPTIKTESIEKAPSQEKVNNPAEPSAFEVDEVSQEMLAKSASNPKELLTGNSPCRTFEDIHVLATHTGTISKTKNGEKFKRPLPAVISEFEYACVNNSDGSKQVKSTTMGQAVDAKTKTLRCIQSSSDPTLTREIRLQNVINTMTAHCGFTLSEHHVHEKDE